MSIEPLPRRRRRAPSTTSLVAVAALAMLLAGCVTGERPTLRPAPVVDDPAAQVVLERLERAGSVAFTATYDIIPSTTGEPTTATVRQADGERRVTIGAVDFVVSGGSSRTCRLGDAGETDCVGFIEDARVSDLNITHRFWSDAPASRLTIDAARRVGFSTGHTEQIAGMSAACADVPVLGGEVVYCALDAGVLARYFGADVTIELTSFTTDVDRSALNGDVPAADS